MIVPSSGEKTIMCIYFVGKVPQTNPPPGVPPLLGHNYIMGQPGVPYFHVSLVCW